MKAKRCPYCKKTNKGFVGQSIYFCCGGTLGDHFECEMCGALWREVTKEVVVRRVTIDDEGGEIL